jgi:hypothetical protein
LEEVFFSCSHTNIFDRYIYDADLVFRHPSIIFICLFWDLRFWIGKNNKIVGDWKNKNIVDAQSKMVLIFFLQNLKNSNFEYIHKCTEIQFYYFRPSIARVKRWRNIFFLWTRNKEKSIKNRIGYIFPYYHVPADNFPASHFSLAISPQTIKDISLKSYFSVSHFPVPHFHRKRFMLPNGQVNGEWS